MTAKTKVADLPQDERDALINEAKEWNIRGIYDTWNVDTLKSKIAAAKAAKGNGSSETPVNKNVNAGTNTENNVDEKTSETVEQNGNNDEKNSVRADDENKEEKPKPPNVAKNKGQAYIQPAKKSVEKTKICHICRSKVINSKCTGCGFELKK